MSLGDESLSSVVSNADSEDESNVEENVESSVESNVDSPGHTTVGRLHVVEQDIDENDLTEEQDIAEQSDTSEEELKDDIFEAQIKNKNKLHISIPHFFVMIINIFLTVAHLILIYTNKAFKQSKTFRDRFHAIVLSMLAIDILMNAFAIYQGYVSNSLFLVLTLIFFIVYGILYFTMKSEFMKKKFMNADVSYLVITLFFWANRKRWFNNSKK